MMDGHSEGGGATDCLVALRDRGLVVDVVVVVVVVVVKVDEARAS